MKAIREIWAIEVHDWDWTDFWIGIGLFTVLCAVGYAIAVF
jgi:hypothetical protein